MFSDPSKPIVYGGPLKIPLGLEGERERAPPTCRRTCVALRRTHHLCAGGEVAWGGCILFIAMAPNGCVRTLLSYLEKHQTANNDPVCLTGCNTNTA